MLRACRRFSTARLAGWATVEGTDRYSQRSRRVEASHFRVMMPQGIETTSLGIGTYVGPADSETDELMHNAIVTSVRSGTVNHIDTAINYRYQKSERCVGRALRSLAEEGVQREEYIVASKVGFVPDDADTNEEGSALVQQLTKQGKVQSEDFVQGHCLHPAFLQDQLERSLQNLGLETLDVLYLHNPAEAQLQKLGKQKFMDRLAKAFEFCESARTTNKLKHFGLATWKCFRTPETDEGMHLSLASVMDLAEKVGGVHHGFHFVQLPINVAMPEAFIFKWQSLEGTQELFLNVAKRLKVNVIVSSPLLQGRAVDVKLSKTMLGVEPQGARHVQLLRSIPSSSIKCVLVGMKNPDHVLMNTQVAYIDPLVSENFLSYLKPEGLMDVQVTTKLWQLDLEEQEEVLMNKCERVLGFSELASGKLSDEIESFSVGGQLSPESLQQLWKRFGVLETKTDGKKTPAANFYTNLLTEGRWSTKLLKVLTVLLGYGSNQNKSELLFHLYEKDGHLSPEGGEAMARDICNLGLLSLPRFAVEELESEGYLDASVLIENYAVKLEDARPFAERLIKVMLFDTKGSGMDFGSFEEKTGGAQALFLFSGKALRRETLDTFKRVIRNSKKNKVIDTHADTN